MKTITKHSLKRFKLPVILVSVLMLWGGFSLPVYAIGPWQAGWDSVNYYDSCEAAIQGQGSEPQITLTSMVLVNTSEPRYEYDVLYTSNYNNGEYVNYNQEFFCYYWLSLGPECLPPSEFDFYGVCQPPTPTPPPPEKNLGDCLEGPSPYVASDAK